MAECLHGSGRSGHLVDTAGVSTGIIPSLPKLDGFQRQEARKRLATGESPCLIARSYGVSRSTIERVPA